MCAAVLAVLTSVVIPHHHDVADHDESCVACRFQHDCGVMPGGSVICHRCDTAEETVIVARAAVVFQKIIIQAAPPRGPPAFA